MARSIQTIEADLQTIRDKARKIEPELGALAEKDELTDGEQIRFSNLGVALDRLKAEKLELEEEKRAVERADILAGVASGRYGVETGDGAEAAGGEAPRYNRPLTVDPAAPPNELRDQARTVVDRWADVKSSTREAMTQTLDRLEDGEHLYGIARHLATYSDPGYVSAFRRFLQDPHGFRDLLTDKERDAWRRTRLAQVSQRATFDSAAAVLPSPLESEILLSNVGSQNPMRQVARVVQTTSNAHRFITSAGITASYDAESGTEVSDDTPSLTEVTVNVEDARAMVIASLAAAADQPGWAEEIAKMFGDARHRLEGTKFVKGAGSGSNEPLGIETELTGGSYEYDAAGETVAAQDVYDLIENLDVRWRPMATWQLELSTLNAIRRLYNPTGSEPPLVQGREILGLPFVLNSNLDPYSGIDAGATATHRPVILGSWNQFVVLDRLGGTIYPPQLLQGNTTGRFTSEVGWLYHWRSGSGNLIDSAFAMMKVSTTA